MARWHPIACISIDKAIMGEVKHGAEIADTIAAKRDEKRRLRCLARVRPAPLVTSPVVEMTKSEEPPDPSVPPTVPTSPIHVSVDEVSRALLDRIKSKHVKLLHMSGNDYKNITPFPGDRSMLRRTRMELPIGTQFHLKTVKPPRYNRPYIETQKVGFRLPKKKQETPEYLSPVARSKTSSNQRGFHSAFRAVGTALNGPKDEGVKSEPSLLLRPIHVEPDEAVAGAYVDNLIKRGRSETERKNYRGAIAKFSSALYQDPNSIVALFGRGVAYALRKDWAKADRDFTTCLEEGPHTDEARRSATTFYNRGIARANLHDIEGAIEDFSAAVRLHNSELDFYFNRALCLRSQDRWTEALDDYESMNKMKLEAERLEKEEQNKPSTPEEGKDRLGNAFNLGGVAGASTERRATSLLSRTKSTSELQALKEEKKKGVIINLERALKRAPVDRSEAEIEYLISVSRRLKCLSGCSDDDLRLLWRYAVYRKYEAKERLFEKGDPSDSFIIVFQGAVSVRLSRELIKEARLEQCIGDEVVVNTMFEGDYVGESVADEGAVRSAACVAHEPLEVLYLDREGYLKTFHQFLTKAKHFKENILRSMPIFSNWPREKIVSLAFISREQVYESDEIVIHQGQPPDGLYFVLSGCLKKVRNITDATGVKHRAQVGKAMAGDIFGEEVLLDQSGNSHVTIVAEYRARVLRIDRMQLPYDEFSDKDIEAFRAIVPKYTNDAYLLQYEVDAGIWEEERKGLFEDIFKASQEKAEAKKLRQAKFKLDMDKPAYQMSRHIREINGSFATPRK